MMRRGPATIALAAMVALCSPAAAEDRPSTTRLVVAGGLMAVPTYLLGVAWHEGSHALWAHVHGAKVTELRLLPGFHPRTGRFFFGWTSWRGKLTCPQHAWVLLSPKAFDLALLGGYAALQLSDTLPDNAYGELALGVLATGAWVDFGRDVFSTRHDNDLVVTHRLYGRTRELQRLPWRVLHGALVVATGALVVHGLSRALRADDGPRHFVVPLWRASFP